MAPKLNPLKLNPLQLRTLTLLQAIARLPGAATAGPGPGEATIELMPKVGEYLSLMMALVVTAVVIAVSRVLLGLHFLTGVLARSLIGVTLGRLRFHIFRFHFFHLL